MLNKPVITAHQPSLTEWLAEIWSKEQSGAFREEDNKKPERLEVLYQEIGLPYERPEAFPARELFDLSPQFQKILEERGNELCAIRLVPNTPGLPKIRNRGLSIKECYETWLLRQSVNPDEYTAYVCPHSEKLLWSATFIINEQAIFGEIIKGLHSQLTHGDTVEKLLQFQYNFQTWHWSSYDQEAQQQIQNMIDLLYVDAEIKQERIKHILSASFFHNHLGGYFDVTVWPNGKTYFIDYNRLLPNYISTPAFFETEFFGDELLHGSVAYPGIVEGPVCAVESNTLTTVDFPKGAILVCDNTDVRYLPLMKKAGAIVTNRGGTLSHASIVARELHIPCIVGTRNATELLQNGDTIHVDAVRGIIQKI